MSRLILKRIISPLYSSSTVSRHLLKSQIPKPNPNSSLLPTLSAPSSSNFRSFCTSEVKNDEEVIIPPNLEKLFPGIKYYPVEEFDKMVADYRNGNKKLVSVLLRAILARKVSGKHDGADKEIMDEISEDLKKKEDEEEYEFYNWRKDAGINYRDGTQGPAAPKMKIDMSTTDF